jgi:hypothetical protein
LPATELSAWYEAASNHREKDETMVSLKLVRLIEEHSNELTDQLVYKLHSASRTCALREVSPAELRSRVQELLWHFHTWLVSKTDSKMQERYIEIGRHDASRNVALPDLCWAIIVIKEHVWEFVERQAFHSNPVEILAEFELMRFMDLFFDNLLCCVVEGYQQQRDQRREVRQSSIPKHVAGQERVRL